MATRHKTTQEAPVVLPVGFNAWLLDCAPARGCTTCQSEWQKLCTAKNADNIAQAARHATAIRDHAGGGHR